ncbi:MAG: isoprenyl transferase [Actinomycetaceae bacterium]|nr:isoprenyl transferase [Actinomycetaceae bacterium]
MTSVVGDYVQVAAPGAGPRMPDSLKGKAPNHIALIMDGNGRWANERGLPRTHGHQAGEAALMDIIAGAVQAGVQYLSVYAFSTENWKRSPQEVRFLMGYSRQVLRRRRDELNSWNVRIHWAGRRPRLWSSVIKELQQAEELTKNNTGLNLVMCVNYGGRTELVDAIKTIAAGAKEGRINPGRITEATVSKHLYIPHMPDVDLLIRTSGEQRTSNFLPWQAAYAEMIFTPEAFPEYDRTTLWRDMEIFASRDRRFGGAVDQATGPL